MKCTLKTANEHVQGVKGNLGSAGNCTRLYTSVRTALHVHEICVWGYNYVCLGSEDASVSCCIPVTPSLPSYSPLCQKLAKELWIQRQQDQWDTDEVHSLRQSKMRAKSEAIQIVASPMLFMAGLPRGSCRSTCNMHFWHEYCVNYWAIHISADTGSEACSLPAT